MKAYTFPELSAMEIVSPKLLIATMVDYARSRKPIQSRVVIEIIDRTPMTRKQVGRLRAAASTGIQCRERRLAAHYRAVRDYLNARLNETLEA